MGSLKIFWYLFLFSFSYSFAFAEVNIAFGEFKIQHKEKVHSKLELIRNYSSRSLYKGLFGYGWCSSWDFHKNVSSNNQEIFLCQDKIIPKEKITFNKQGEVLSIESKNQQILFIRDEKSLIRKHQKNNILNSKNIIYVFMLQNLVNKIESANHTFNYSYSSKKLERVSNAKTILFHYEYDLYANMTKWQSANEIEKMSYVSELDLIQSYTQKDLCQNKYNYSFLNKSKFILQERKCLTQNPQTIKYSFDYELKKIKIQILNTVNNRLGEKNEDTITSSL